LRYFLLLLFLATSQHAFAKTPTSIRIGFGGINYPLREWSNFMGEIINGTYERDKINIYGYLSFYYSLNPKHSLFVGTELLRTTAQLKCDLVVAKSTTDYNFQGIPINIGYEYKMPTKHLLFSPILDFGLSYFISQAKCYTTTDPAIFPPQTLTRKGKGYGVNGGLGFISQFTNSFYSTFQFRARYADGMYFTDQKEDIVIEFSSYDIHLGIGWCF